jgi:hypothetical protein
MGVVVAKSTVLLLVAAAALYGCAQAPTEVNAPAAGPQPLLPEAYSGQPAGSAPTIAQSGAVTSAQPPTYPVLLAPAGERYITGGSGVLFNPYRPHWEVGVQ